MPPRGGPPLPRSKPFARSSRGSTWSLQASRRRRSGSGNYTLSWIRRPLPRRDRSTRISVLLRVTYGPPSLRHRPLRANGTGGSRPLLCSRWSSGRRGNRRTIFRHCSDQVLRSPPTSRRAHGGLRNRKHATCTWGKTGGHMPASNGTGTSWSGGLNPTYSTESGTRHANALTRSSG